MYSIWCHSSGRRRSRRLVWNPLTPSPGPRFFSHLLLRDAADLGTYCARRKRTELNQLSVRGAGGSPPQSSACILDHISGSYLFCGLGGRGGVEARLLHISCCWIARRWSRCSEAVGLRASTLQPGTMSPESLKFVLLAALQALSVCDGLVSKPDEGKSWSWGTDFEKLLASSFHFLRNCALWSFWVHRVKWIIVGCLKYDTCLRLYAIILCMINNNAKSVFGNHRKDASAFCSFLKRLFQSITKVTLLALFVWSEMGSELVGKLSWAVFGLFLTPQQQLKDISWRGSVSDVMSERVCAWSSPFGLWLMTTQSPAFTPRVEFSMVHLHSARGWRCPEDAAASKQSGPSLWNSGNEVQSQRKLYVFIMN